MNRAKGVCAVATLLILYASVFGVAEGAHSPPEVSFILSEAPAPADPFDVTLKVKIDPYVLGLATVWGKFHVQDPEGLIVYEPPPIFSDGTSWYIDFDGIEREDWETEGWWTFEKVEVLSAGDYYLWAEVHWYKLDGDEDWAIKTQKIDVASLVRYYIEWLKPISLGKPFKAGSTIKIKFSVFDSPTDGKFVHDDTVKVTYSKTGTESEFELSPVRIKDNTECYIVYWKTEKGMSGYYTITVTFANAQATPPAIITIRP